MNLTQKLTRLMVPIVVAGVAAAAPALADLPIHGTQVGTISHISDHRSQFELRLGNGVSYHVHFGKARLERGYRDRSWVLRDGERVRVFYNGIDPNDRGLDATRIEIERSPYKAHHYQAYHYRGYGRYSRR